MVLFGKKPAIEATTDDASSPDMLADSKYREELRQIGREQFKEIIGQQSAHLEQEVQAMMERVTTDLKEHTARQVDALMGRLNTEVTNQLNDQMREYGRVSGEAQELLAQSLAQNAQIVHEKYQQLSMNMQQVVANQEVVMATVFQDSKTQVASVQSEQTKLLELLKQSGETTRSEAEQLSLALRQTVSGQAEKLNAVYSENMASVEATRDAQAVMLENLQRTTDTLEAQHQQLSELLDKSIVDQKAMVVDVINENMARIVEHYLIGALGEQSSLREQIPSILQQMEQNKQAMVDDMKL